MGVPPERLLKLPEKPEDPGWADIKAKLGMAAPDTPEGYELDVPEGFSPDYAQKAAEWAKELGIPKHMLKGLASKQNEFVKAALEAEEKAVEQRVSSSLAKLKAEWGQSYDSSMAIAQRAEAGFKQEIGLDDDTAKAWSDANPELYFKLLAFHGSKASEARLVDGDAPKSDQGMSPEAARVKLKQLMADRDWFERYDRQDADARAEWKKLNEIIRQAGQ
jgi:hypothetical protein